MDSMFFSENPTSLLNTSSVAGAPLPVMSLVVNTNSKVGSTPCLYSLSSAFYIFSGHQETKNMLSSRAGGIYTYTSDKDIHREGKYVPE